MRSHLRVHSLTTSLCVCWAPGHCPPCPHGRVPHPQSCRLCPPCPHIWPCASSTGLQVRVDGKLVCEMEAMYHANGILDRTSECTLSGTPTEGDGTSQGGFIIHAGQHVEFVGACARGAKLEHPTDKRIGCIHLYIQLVPHHIATPHLIATPRTFSGQLKQHIGHTGLYTRLWLTLAARCCAQTTIEWPQRTSWLGSRSWRPLVACTPLSILTLTPRFGTSPLPKTGALSIGAPCQARARFPFRPRQIGHGTGHGTAPECLEPSA